MFPVLFNFAMPFSKAVFGNLAIEFYINVLHIMFLQHYQALFRDGECFLHVVSLLNGNLDEANGERLVLIVLQTLTCLLASNDASKVICIPSFICFLVC